MGLHFYDGFYGFDKDASWLGPACPTEDVLDDNPTNIDHLSSSLLWYIFTLVNFVFGIVIAVKYNSVKVFEKKIRTETISNNYWVAFFMLESLRGVAYSLRYTLESKDKPKDAEDVLFLSSHIFTCFMTLVLCLSLNHQRKFRSNIKSTNAGVTPETPELPSTATSESSSLLKKEELFLLFDLADYIILVLSLISLVSVFVVSWYKGHTIANYCFIGAYSVQRVPIVVLTFIICINKAVDGPSIYGKLYVGFGTFFGLVESISVDIWAQLLPRTCTLEIASLSDLLLVLSLVSVVFYFVFVKAEYLRNMEECIWDTVSNIQNTFNFRKF